MKANENNYFFWLILLNKFDLISNISQEQEIDMRTTTISIYPDCNGTVLVSACKENYEIKFITNKKNIIYLIFLTQLKLIKRALFKNFSYLMHIFKHV